LCSKHNKYRHIDGTVKVNSYRGKDSSLACIMINSFKHQHELEKLKWHSIYVNLTLSVHETKMLLNLKSRMRCTTSIAEAYYKLLQGITSINYLTPCSRLIHAMSITAQLVRNSTQFWNPNVHHHVHKPTTCPCPEELGNCHSNTEYTSHLGYETMLIGKECLMFTSS